MKTQVTVLALIMISLTFCACSSSDNKQNDEANRIQHSVQKGTSSALKLLLTKPSFTATVQ